jgi:hypothetical protein
LSLLILGTLLIISIKIVYMKIKRLLSSGLLLVFCLCAGVVQAQKTGKSAKSEKAEEIKALLAAQNYVFKAESALPLGGGIRFLTSEYDLKITKNGLESYLPYFGRAFVAPINPSEGGIKFKSADFDYSSAVKKKGGWDIKIKPNDTRAVRDLILFVSETGKAILQVNPENKQTITFNGYIEANEDSVSAATK